MKNFSHKGGVLSLIAPRALLSGEAFMVGAIFAVAAVAAANGAAVEGVTHGVYALPKTSGQAWTVGARIYWDNTNYRCDTSSSAGTLIGAAAAPALSAATSGTVCLGGIVTGASVPAATVPGQPAAPVLTAMANAVSVAWTAAPAGSTATLATEYTDINGTVTALTTNPQVIAATAGAATTGTVRARNAQGYGPASPQSNSVTPSGAVTARLLNVGTNQRWLGGITGTAGNPIPDATDTPESIFRQPTMIGGGDVSEVYLFWPTWGNGNNGDESLGAFQIHSSAIELNGSTATAKFTYGGQETRQVLEGELTTIQGQSTPVAGVLSDPITSAQLLAAFGKNHLTRGDKVWKRGRMVRADRTVKFGITRLMSQDASGQSFRFKPDSVAAIPDVYGTGTMVMTRTGIVGTLFSEATGFDPILLGKYVNEEGIPVLGLLGASMEHGATDLTWAAPLNSGRGMMRATFDKDGLSNPYAGLVVAAAGNTLDDMNGTNKHSYCTAAWVTHMELSPGGNDLGSADATSDTTKYTSIQVQLRALWADLRAINPTLKLCALSKPPSTVSTDGHITDTNQTPGAEYGEGQKVELLYRDWLLGQVGISGGIDAVIDPVAMHWPSKRWLWASATSTPAVLGGAAVGAPANQNHPGTGQYKLISNDIRTFCGMPAWPNTP